MSLHPASHCSQDSSSRRPASAERPTRGEFAPTVQVVGSVVAGLTVRVRSDTSVRADEVDRGRSCSLSRSSLATTVSGCRSLYPAAVRIVPILHRSIVRAIWATGSTQE